MKEIDVVYRDLLFSLYDKSKDALDAFKIHPTELVDEGRCTSVLFVTRDELVVIISLVQAEMITQGICDDYFARATSNAE